MRSNLYFVLFAFAIPAVAAVDFNRDIRPILSDNCFTCHGPDGKRRMANLRLDQKEGGAFRVIAAGDSAHSKLYDRISTEKKGMRMPPGSATQVVLFLSLVTAMPNGSGVPIVPGPLRVPPALRSESHLRPTHPPGSGRIDPITLISEGITVGVVK